MDLRTHSASRPNEDGYLYSKGAAWFAFAMTIALMVFDYVDRQVIVSITTGPEDVPLLTSTPRGCRLSSEDISVSRPTES